MNRSLLDTIRQSQRLPSLPQVALDLLDVTRNPLSSCQEIANVIRIDPALSAKIIRTANSPLYGLRREVTRLDFAVSLLGRTAILASSLSFLLTDDAVSGPTKGAYDRFWAKSLMQAVSAECLGRQFNPGANCDLFLMGLLLDIGQLGLLHVVGAEYLPLLQETDLMGKTLMKREREVFGFDHRELGEVMMTRWGLPELFSTAISYHHESWPALEKKVLADQLSFLRIAGMSAAIGDALMSHRKDLAHETLEQYATDAAFQIDEGIPSFVLMVAQEGANLGRALEIDPEIWPGAETLMREGLDMLAVSPPSLPSALSGS